MDYNQVIAKLYKLNNKLLNDDKIDDALVCTNIAFRFDNLADPTQEQVKALNKAYNTLYERNYKVQ